MKQLRKKANVTVYSMRARGFVRLSAGAGIGLALSLLAATLAGNANNNTVSGPKVTAPPATPAPATTQEGSAGSRVEVELITLHPSGFHPVEITRPPGLFILAVENRSGLDEVELMLDREAGSRLYQAQVRRRKPKWHQSLDLAPGRYILTEASDPEWKCYIDITGR